MGRDGDRRERGGDWADGPARAAHEHCAGRARFLSPLLLSVVPAGNQYGQPASIPLALSLRGA